MAYQGVTIKGTNPGNGLTFILEDSITEEHVGLAVTQDKTAANKVKLAGDGDPILGKLLNVENRSVIGVKTGAVQVIGGVELKKSSASIAVGDTIEGAGNGEVKKSTTGTNIAVWEVKTNSVIVMLK